MAIVYVGFMGLLAASSSTTVGTATATRPRVLVADDHTLLADAFAHLLAPHCEVVAIVGDGESAIAEAERLRPDVIVLDISMPRLNGLDVGRSVRQRLPRTKLVYLTMTEDPDVASEAFRIGASAFLLKSSAASELLTAIRASMNGQSYVTPRVTQALVDTCGPPRVHTLTPRQRDVLTLIARGLTMKEVAATLDVTPRTVAFHKYQMMQQLRITSTAELIQFAIRQHLV